TPEMVEKLSVSMRGNTNALGHRHTPETRARISAALKKRLTYTIKPKTKK
ncbi:hypothetical protein LCGC14_2095500, partial [marine sediment metagenome]